MAYERFIRFADESATANRVRSFSHLIQVSILIMVIAVNATGIKASAQVNEWGWMGGSDTQGKAGIYGTLGTSAPGNVPGARGGAASARDGKGNFWLFGGIGFDSAGAFDSLNDLWEFNVSTNQWTW